VAPIDLNEVEMMFKEKESITLIIKKHIADLWLLEYTFVASWITLTIHSSLEAVGKIINTIITSFIIFISISNCYISF
jgi:hypothetical protein